MHTLHIHAQLHDCAISAWLECTICTPCTTHLRVCACVHCAGSTAFDSLQSMLYAHETSCTNACVSSPPTLHHFPSTCEVAMTNVTPIHPDTRDQPPYSPGDPCWCAACVAAGETVHPHCRYCNKPLTRDRHWCPDKTCAWHDEL
jgi:hypothetical protein